MQVHKPRLKSASIYNQSNFFVQDKLSFEIKKSVQSHINMAAEVEKFQEAVTQGQIVLHVHYIRPIVATEALIHRSFREWVFILVYFSENLWSLIGSWEQSKDLCIQYWHLKI